MADDIERPAPLPSFADDKFYKVQLYKAANYAGRTMAPADKLVMKGDVAKEIADSIYRAEEVPPNPLES